MKAKRLRFLFLAFILLIPVFAGSWGFWAHGRINRIAVFTLPKPMLGFYKSYIEHLTGHAADADKRRFSDKDEAPRHYIDLEYYGQPYDSIPHGWNDAVAKYTVDSMKSWGIVPWHIQTIYWRLTQAFKEKDAVRILHLSSDLGHYIGDAHVPLHTTENYDGQLTGQRGIHSFWESRLPELFGEEYDYFVGKAYYINDVPGFVWQRVIETRSALDSVLRFEHELSLQFPEDKKYGYEDRNGKMVRVYTLDYSHGYHEKLNGMVERQMRRAIIALGSLWMSAWIDAGQPDLDDLINPVRSKEEEKTTDEEEDLYRKGKWLGRPEE
ncbi:MAG: zinc dependent phospholipase C family protein [Bacteroidota bacterium]|nr:zinc dependent phospholipase C family protein [Bacteroidota bacterium]